MRVAELEGALLERFPARDAEPWDHVGLSVGDPRAEITGVRAALDATEANVRLAAQLGANVLLTHHPVYIEAPAAFTPALRERPAAAAAVFEAARLGVSVISLHTNLDRSREARDILPARMGLAAASSLEHPEEPDAPGLGTICETIAARPLLDVVDAAAQAFGSVPRAWGPKDAPVSRIALLGGSLGHLGELAVGAGADVIITGEAGYHVCQDLMLRGISIVLLGHDRSEEPFVDILASAAADAGVDASLIATIDGPRQWWTPREGERA